MEKRQEIINISQETLRHILIAGSSLEDVLDDNFCEIVELIKSCDGKVVFSGLGKSGHIANKLTATFNSLGIKAVFLHPTEAFHGDLGVVDGNDILLAFSNSGETQELIKLIEHFKKIGIKTVLIAGHKDSSLVRLVDYKIIYKIDNEGSPFDTAPMASTTVSLIIGYLVASAVSKQRGFARADFNNFHPGGQLGLKNTLIKNILKEEDRLPLVYDQQSFAEALQEITKKGLGVTCVVNEAGLLLGILTDGDIRRFILSDKFSIEAGVTIAMTKQPITINENDSLQKAIEIMEENKITSLVVVSNNKPRSIIHLHDIIENHII
jgi:arabinose-5-phosphate isomerase